MISELLAIYTEAIPASERKSEMLFRAMLDDPNYQLQVAHKEGRVVGFSLARLSIAEDTALLEYLAVATKYRGQGIGQSLFPSGSGITLIEVDLDNTRLRRFYRRQGAREVEAVPYLMPNVSAETPPAMSLWVACQSIPASISRFRLQSWLEGIYQNVYGLASNDLRLAVMLNQAPSQILLK